MTEISVIVASRNAAATIAETLEGLSAQEWDGAWEIVLADNGSTDDTVAIFREHAGRHPGIPMRLVDAGQRRGKSHALNVGIRAALERHAEPGAVPGDGADRRVDRRWRGLGPRWRRRSGLGGADG